MKFLKICPLLVFAAFLAVAISLWLALDNIFYLFNFLYIGTFISVGILLFFVKKSKYARLVVQIGVGMYMMVYLGIIHRENMNIAGFWFYLFNGLFQAAVIHYLVAKILGPLLFGRGWCGWACWTGAVLDLFPFKKPCGKKIKGLGLAKYLFFIVPLVTVVILFVLRADNMENIMWWSFIGGNILYYAIGIVLAFVLKDNRAFCKYICPVVVFLKPASHFSLLRFKSIDENCVKCRLCEKACPMEVEITNPSRKRKNATECIACCECIRACPKKSKKLF
ncbi:MAG: 4Fe-4S binding protein [Firmicutes bacterium]|nr:4Fe-4S binding protein [Bacillota bacterium]